jgi:hypothetical protein
MTQPTALRLRQLASPRRQHPAGRTGRRAAALLLRLSCAALLAWIGYIHLHLWLEGYRQIPTDGPCSCSTRWPDSPSPPRSWPGRGR